MNERKELGIHNEILVQRDLQNYNIPFIKNVNTKGNGEIDICIQDTRFEKNSNLEVTTDKTSAISKCLTKQYSLKESQYIVTTQDIKNQRTIYKIIKNEKKNTYSLDEGKPFKQWIETYL